eukprot:jgi/Picsp_1/1472/NSC_04950-R1_qc- bet1 mbet1 family
MNSRFNSSKYSGNHSASMDIESLEKRNDATIASLGEKSALLKHITSSIHGEVSAQHTVLDRMAQGVGGVQMGLQGTVTKIQRVMEGPEGRKIIYIALAIVVIIFVLYLWGG